MITQHMNLGRAVGLIFVVTLFILGCKDTRVLLTDTGDSSQLPVRKLRVTVNKSQREELFNQLRDFANHHDLKFILTDYGTGDNFLVEILGADIKILAVISRPDPEIMSIGFYSKTPEDPPPDEKTVDDLLKDLKRFISEIPNATITEER